MRGTRTALRRILAPAAWKTASKARVKVRPPPQSTPPQPPEQLYFRPGLGHIRLLDLRDHHFRDLYTAMRLINRPAQDENQSDLLRRLLEARSERDGKRVSSRPLSEARIKRIHAVALSALSDTVPQTLPHHPAATVRLGGKRGCPQGQAPAVDCGARRALEADRGDPAPVMVWTAAQCGAFLDSLEAAAAGRAAVRAVPCRGLLRAAALRAGWPGVG
jgi:hypothetical protein